MKGQGCIAIGRSQGCVPIGTMASWMDRRKAKEVTYVYDAVLGESRPDLESQNRMAVSEHCSLGESQPGSGCQTGSQQGKTAGVESDLFRPPVYDEEDDDNESNCSSESGCLELWQKAFGKKEFGRGTFDNDSRTQNIVNKYWVRGGVAPPR